MKESTRMTNTTKSYSERLIEASADKLIAIGQEEQIRDAGENSRDHGFHDDWPKVIEGDENGPSWEEHKTALRRAITEKLALIHEEISEALGEIRSGRDPLEIYYSHTEKIMLDGKKVAEHITYYDEQKYDGHGIPQYKPEGFLVELADADIRLHDLVFLVEGEQEYLQAHRDKRRFNTTRPYKHGRKF